MLVQRFATSPGVFVVAAGGGQGNRLPIGWIIGVVIACIVAAGAVAFLKRR